MIKHYVFKNEKGNMCVKSVMRGCEDDAIRYLKKLLPYVDGLPFDVAKMPRSFERVVECDPRDTFDVMEGIDKADARVLRGYYDSRNKALKRFQNKVNQCKLRETLDMIETLQFIDTTKIC